VALEIIVVVEAGGIVIVVFLTSILSSLAIIDLFALFAYVSPIAC
jgi:hypothetical protein